MSKKLIHVIIIIFYGCIGRVLCVYVEVVASEPVFIRQGVALSLVL